MEQDIKNNKHNILRFKEQIKKLNDKQKENRKITRQPHNCDTWNYQRGEFELKRTLFISYTAYYIVKHYLWLEENKERYDEYLDDIIKKAKHVFNHDYGYPSNVFKIEVKDLVNRYTTE